MSVDAAEGQVPQQAIELSVHAAEITETGAVIRVRVVFGWGVEGAALVLRPLLPGVSINAPDVLLPGDTLWVGSATEGEVIERSLRVAADMRIPHKAVVTLRPAYGQGAVDVVLYGFLSGIPLEGSTPYVLYENEVNALLEARGLAGAPADVVAREAPLLQWRIEHSYLPPAIDTSYVDAMDGTRLAYLSGPAPLLDALPPSARILPISAQEASDKYTGTNPDDRIDPNLEMPTIDLKPEAALVEVPEDLQYHADFTLTERERQRAYFDWATRVKEWYRSQGLLRE